MRSLMIPIRFCLALGFQIYISTHGVPSLFASCTTDQLIALANRESDTLGELSHLLNHGTTPVNGSRVVLRTSKASSIPQSEVDDLVLSAVVDDPTRILMHPENTGELWIRDATGERFYRAQRQTRTVQNGEEQVAEAEYIITEVRMDVPPAVRRAYAARLGGDQVAASAPALRDRYTGSELMELLSIRRRESRLPIGTFNLTVSRPPPGVRAAETSIRVRFLDPTGFSAHHHAESALRALGNGFARAENEAGLKYISANHYELKMMGVAGDTRFLVCLRNGVYEIGRAFDHQSADRIFSARPCN
jgi:hypothetical protein